MSRSHCVERARGTRSAVRSTAAATRSVERLPGLSDVPSRLHQSRRLLPTNIRGALSAAREPAPRQLAVRLNFGRGSQTRPPPVPSLRLGRFNLTATSRATILDFVEITQEFVSAGLRDA